MSIKLTTSQFVKRDVRLRKKPLLYGGELGKAGA
jgi:hypothetical protein